MKKVYYFIVFIGGINMISKGIYGLFALNIVEIFETNVAFNYENLFWKVVRIVTGIYLIKYGYESYCNEKRGEVTY